MLGKGGTTSKAWKIANPTAIAHGMHLIVNVQCCSAQWYNFRKTVCNLEQAPFMQDVADSEIGLVETDLGIENGPCNKAAQEGTPEAQEEEPIAEDEDEASEPQAPTVIPDNILQESGCLHNQDGNKIVTDDKPSKDLAAKVSPSPSCSPLWKGMSIWLAFTFFCQTCVLRKTLAAKTSSQLLQPAPMEVIKEND